MRPFVTNGTGRTNTAGTLAAFTKHPGILRTSQTLRSIGTTDTVGTLVKFTEGPRTYADVPQIFWSVPKSSGVSQKCPKTAKSVPFWDVIMALALALALALV